MPEPATGSGGRETDVKRPRLKARYVAAALICVGAIVWMVVGGLAKNLVYLKPVSKAVAERADLGTRRFRMGGTVLPGSVSETATGVRFEISEGGVTAEVDHDGDPPSMFKECAPVVVEGRWDHDAFRSDRLLIKHGEDYTPDTGKVGDCPGVTKGPAGQSP